jgi:PAS domain-containing protein
MSAHIQTLPIQSSFPAEFIDAAPYAAWLKTPDGYYIAANTAADQIMGRRIVGATTEDLYGANATQIREYEQAALRNGCHSVVQTVGKRVVTVTRYLVYRHGHALIGGIAIEAKASLTT